MTTAIDTSVIIGALDGADPDHAACRALVLSSRCVVWSHALTETFSTLTGGRLGLRLAPTDAATLLREQLTPRLRVVTLSEKELLRAYDESMHRGVRGGAIYDYLHLVAARAAGAQRFCTLDVSDFRSFHRAGDPQIAHP